MTKRTQKVVADVCLYGNSKADVGCGWLAQLAGGGLLWASDPVSGRTWTEALWLACEAIRLVHGACGERPRNGIVRVFAAGGQLMAETSLQHPAYYGDLKWSPAPQYVIDADQLVASAS